MDKMRFRLLLAVWVIGLLAFGAVIPSRLVLAQNALEPTQILIGAPPTVTLGKPVTVQAVLADSHGRPISKAQILFTAEARFLGNQNEVVLAQAVTNANGQAVAEIVDDFSYGTNLRAEFKGDDQYAPSDATILINAASEQQVYVEHVGVDIPGYNVPPLTVPAASIAAPHPGLAQFIQNLWPAMTGWPVAAVLLLVWSMYLLTVWILLRVPAGSGGQGDTSDLESRRSE
jgi:hypothetical protein